ncbi:hypothetical protein ACSVDA_23185 [Cytobacillus sp. Hm23]
MKGLEGIGAGAGHEEKWRRLFCLDKRWNYNPRRCFLPFRIVVKRPREARRRNWT